MEFQIMEIIKILLLIFAYTLGIATLIIQIICYIKDLEYKEMIFFTIAFLLLIVAMTIQGILRIGGNDFSHIQKFVTNLLTVLFTISIPVNIHKERVDKFRIVRNGVVVIIGIIIMILSSLFYFFNNFVLIAIILSIHLFCTVVYSMLFVLFTKPGSLVQFREKTERFTAIFILTLMTSTLVVLLLNIRDNSLIIIQQYGGFILATICIVLSLTKIPTDIKKLTRKEINISIKESQINLLGITQREKEVLLLLIKGKPYKEIAAELFISLPTVKTHVSNIYFKANVRNRLELSNLTRYHAEYDQ